MPPFVSKIVSNPAVRKAFWTLVLTVLGAAGYSQFVGCTPAQLDTAKDASRAVDALQCVDAALRQYDVLTHPEQTTLEDASALAAELKRCRAVAGVPDGGV
jgi:hypothetical protein